MARILVMDLPAPPDEFPFVLVIDQADPGITQWFGEHEPEALRMATGARGVLIFPDRVDVV